MADRPDVNGHDSVALRDFIEQMFEDHMRLHALFSDGHLRDHQSIAETMRVTASALAENMKITAQQLADTLKTTADTHWQNHEREHVANDRALDKAQQAVRERLDAMDTTVRQNKLDANEWRSSMNDREDRFATKSDWGANAKEIAELKEWRNRSEGKSSGLAPLYAVLLTVAGSVGGAVILHFLLAPK